MDWLYGELDQLTGAAAERHMEHCTRCRNIGSRLKATREVGRLPLVDPPEGLELLILDAERRARAELPLRQRLGRGISVLASYAMRPQLAMAALLLLVIASSLILLRGRPGEQMNLFVTGRGIPESDVETVAIVPRKETPRQAGDPLARDPKSERTSAAARSASPATLAEPEAAGSAEPSYDREYEQALSAYRDRRYEEAQRRFEALASRTGGSAASAALYAAQSARARVGCPTAAPLFEQTYARFPDTQPGYESAWQAAGCYRTLGDFERARHHYELLLKKPGYADRAQAALASMGDTAAESNSEKPPGPVPSAAFTPAP